MTGHYLISVHRFSLQDDYYADILRLLASLKLGKTSAFHILKQLNSYAKPNPLYRALKELGKIIRTCFIRRYLLAQIGRLNLISSVSPLFFTTERRNPSII